MINDEHSKATNYDEAYEKPRVNLSYANETHKIEQKQRRSVRNGINAIVSFIRTRFVSAIKVATASFIILAYPAMTVLGHQIDDTGVEFSQARHWAVPDIGVAAILIARELDGPGWVADKHPWHPQSRLTALPAWQQGLITGLSDHGRLILDVLEQGPDQDLIAAVRLLDINPAHKTTDRLAAASEAFIRYDDRVAGGVAIAPTGSDALIARLTFSADQAGREYAQLAAISNPGDGWLASDEAIESVYHAKAIAHVALAMLEAVSQAESDLLADLKAEEKIADVLSKWQSAAHMRPLFVANQASRSISGTSHPAMMAFRLDQARLATLSLAAHLETMANERAEAAPDSPPLAAAIIPSDGG